MTDRSDVLEVLARYVRAADHRDAAAMADVFLSDGKVEIFHNDCGDVKRIGEIQGADQIGAAVAGMLHPHPPHGWSHHTTSDHIVTVDNDEATIDAQFIVFNTVGDERPETGWPKGAFGAQGRVTPIESGYYRPKLRRVDGHWLIALQTILIDLPIAFPGA